MISFPRTPSSFSKNFADVQQRALLFSIRLHNFHAYHMSIVLYIFAIKVSQPITKKTQRENKKCINVSAVTRGDPHIITIDGLQYTFNGLGEFWLVRSADVMVQGRASRAKNAEGTCFIFAIYTLTYDNNTTTTTT